MTPTHFQLEPLRAVRAARILAADPDQLPQVFTLIESLSWNTLTRVHRRMSEREDGRRLLAEQPDVVQVLADRRALSRLPEGSLGRAYLQFVEAEGISADGIRSAAEDGMRREQELPEHLRYVHRRLRDTHDLWHAAIGYRGDVLGETALLAFTLAQTKNPAIGLIVGIGLAKTTRSPEARRVILNGFRRGRAAGWLVDQPWEDMLARPLVEVRAALGLEEPPVYTPITSAQLREARAAA